MDLQTITLEKVASLFRVHPRTILRAIKGEHNTYWYEDSNSEPQSTEKIAEVYGMRHAALLAVIQGRDTLLNAAEAAKALGMAPRTFRNHLKNKDAGSRWGRVACGGITRYLESKINSAGVDRGSIVADNLSQTVE
jgi:hypothetical protein